MFWLISYFLDIVSKNKYIIFQLDLYLSILCCKDVFFDIVFDVMYVDPMYKPGISDEGGNERTIWRGLFIVINAGILLWCIYVLIFIIIPIIHYRIQQCSKKEERVSEFRENIENKSLTLLQERFTNE